MGRRIAILLSLLLLVGGVVVWRARATRHEPPPAFREDAGLPPEDVQPPVLAEPEYQEGGELLLNWSDVDGADEYEVRFYGPDRAEIGKLTPTPSISRLVQPEEIPSGYARGTVLAWDVTALYGGQPIARSRPAALPIR
jgi:hypothetical protein